MQPRGRLQSFITQGTFMRNITRSTELFRRGRAVVTDGVSSPMRAFALVGGRPIIAASGKGSRLADADGNVYVDFLNSFGALILGHAHDEVVEAIARQAALGTAHGLSSALEYELAEKIVASTPALEKLRFVCSGTEAVMTAARIARAHTGRPRLLKFGGSYHGHSDALLANPENLETAAAKKGATQGITPQLNRDVLLCNYNDFERLEELFVRHGDEIAAVLVEPIATNMGFVKPLPGFHSRIRELCTRHGALFIFDEVVTAFRFNWGGICNTMGVDPDLITFGKIIGGGTPVGAYGGKARFMDQVAIGGKVFQSGTFAANPLTLAAGNAALDVLARPGFYADLEEKGAFLEATVAKQFAARGIPFHHARQGALSGVAFRDGSEPMRSLKDVKTQDYRLFSKVHGRMLDAGFLMAPSLEEPIFMSAAHSRDELARFAAALAESIAIEREDARRSAAMVLPI
jgi:glutamate-1-semialdehyde 2,1-aminomutase